MTNKVSIDQLDDRIAELEELKQYKEWFDNLAPEEKIIELLMEKLYTSHVQKVWGVARSSWGDNRRENRVAFTNKVDNLVHSVGSRDYMVLRRVLKAANIF